VDPGGQDIAEQGAETHNKTWKFIFKNCFIVVMFI